MGDALRPKHMSINGHSTGSFDQPPLSAPNAKPTHDFLGSPVHDRGAFSYYNAWDIFDGPTFSNFAFNQIPFGRHVEKLEAGTNYTPAYGLGQIRSTITGIDLIPAGIYGAVFPRETLPAGADIADACCVRLVGANGGIVNLSAPDNAVGYNPLPHGIISQQSNGDLVNGQVIGPVQWGALNIAPLVINGDNWSWFVVFDSRVLLGSASAFRPQFVQPLAAFFLGDTLNDGTLNAMNIARTHRNFYSVPFKTITGFYVQSGPPFYPPKFSFPATQFDLIGFPSQFR